MSLSTLKHVIAFGLFSFVLANGSKAQNVGINTNAPDAAAALDIRSASGKKQGVLFPTVALTATGDASTITAPPKGLIVWNDGTGGLSPAGYYYNTGTAGTPSWAKVVTGAVMTTTLTDGKIWIGDASNSATERTLSGDVTLSNTGVTTIGANKVDGAKIDLGSSTNGGMMYYNGTDWVNLAPGTGGQILQSNGAAAPTWVNPNTTLTKKDVTTSTTGVSIGSGTGQIVGASNMTVDVASNSSTSPGLVASGSGQVTKVWGTDGSGNPAWKDPNGQLTKKDVTTSTTGVTIGSGTGQVIGASNMTVDVASNSSTSPGLVASGSGQVTKVWGTDGSGNPAWKDPNGQLTKKDIVPNTNSVLTISNGTGQVVGATNVTLDVQGASGGVLYGKGTGAAAAFTGIGTSSQVLHGNGTGTPSFGAVVLTSDVSGILPVANGGTNSSATPTAGGVGYGTGTAHAYTPAGTIGQILQSGVAGAPTWIDKTAILNSQNGLSTVTTGGSASATTPYVELGGSLYKNTTITQAAYTLAFTSTATNGFSVDGTTFSIDAVNHRVGIGTASPGVKVEINSGGGTNTSLKCEHTGSNFIVRPASSGGTISVIENTAGALAINPGAGNVGIGTTTINEKLTIEGTASISSANTLEFGKNVVGKESNAGKIGYQSFTTGALDIVGAGTTSGSRVVKLWDNVIVSGLTGTGNRPVYADATGKLKVANGDNSVWVMSANLASSQDDLAGTVLSANGDDDVAYQVALPFSVIIEGVTYTYLAVNCNGWAQFETGSGTGTNPPTAYSETSLPAASFNGPVVFAYWDDLKDYGSGEAIRSQTFGTSPNRTHVIDWKLRGLSGTVYNVFFQMEIHEGSNLINVKYHSMDAAYCGQSATIGFQLAGGSSAKAYPLTFDGKILDDNAGKAEGWSVCPLK